MWILLRLEEQYSWLSMYTSETWVGILEKDCSISNWSYFLIISLGCVTVTLDNIKMVMPHQNNDMGSYSNMILKLLPSEPISPIYYTSGLCKSSDNDTTAEITSVNGNSSVTIRIRTLFTWSSLIKLVCFFSNGYYY